MCIRDRYYVWKWLWIIKCYVLVDLFHCICVVKCVRSVSYTHLDVYKRQLHDRSTAEETKKLKKPNPQVTNGDVQKILSTYTFDFSLKKYQTVLYIGIV